MTYGRLCREAESVGLACRGGFHPGPDDGLGLAGRPAGTLVLLGFTGAEQWPVFADSGEYRDGLAHPLDRWSRRVVDGLARAWDARALYPFTGPPWWPFQRWAQRAERLHPTPLGVLMHEQYGLWHAYRGALLLAEAIDLPALREWASPCAACPEQWCVAGCPAHALAGGVFDVGACHAHVSGGHGEDCRAGGCLARAACPVAPEARYGEAQAAFHLRAFLRARR